MSDSKLTVIMLNWARPSNVLRLMYEYMAMPDVAQITIVNNGCAPVNAVGWLPEHKKTVTVTSDAPLGLQARFALGAIARTDHVLIVDDDISLPEATVTELYASRPGLHGLARCGAIGLFGRCPREDGTYTTGTWHYGPVPILLTRAVMTTPQVCGEAAWVAVRMSREIGGMPFGNGEDIVMSYVARKLTGHYNLALKLPYQNLNAADVHSISLQPGHEQHRTAVVRWCRKYFGF